MKKVSLPPDILRGQVISKVHWGTSDEEVIQFLETEHGISGNDADTLLTEAHAVRRKEIRRKAILGLLFSGTGLAISITYFAIQFFGGFIRIGMGLFLMLALGVASALALVRSLARLATGSAPGSAT